MTAEEIIKTIETTLATTLPAAVEKAVEKSVNGHIRDIDAKLDKHIDNTEKFRVESYAFMEQMKPVRDGLFTFQNIAKFTKYLGLPAIGIFLMWLFNR